MNKFYVSCVALALSVSAIAEEDKKLKAEFEAGIITTSGNTKTQSYTGKLDIKHDMTKWKNHYILEGLFKRDEVEIDDDTTEDQTTAEKYFGSAQADYKIGKEHASFFAYGEYDRNRFSGFDYQYTLAIGYADRIFTTDNSYLSYNVGPGVTVSQAEEVEGEEQAEEEETFVIRFSAEYLYQISENAKFTQNVSTNYSTDSDKNTKTKSITALTAQLNSSLSLRASYTIDYNSEVTEDRKHADTQTALTVVYSF